MTEKFDQLEKLRDEVSAAAGLPRDHEVVLLVSGLRLAHQNMLEAMIANREIDSEKLVGLTRMIKELTPPPKQEPINVTLEFVPPADAAPASTGVDGHVACRHCHWQCPPGEYYSRCPRCGWKDGMDTQRMPDDPFGGVGGAGGSNNNGSAGGGAVEPAAAAAQGRRFGPVKAKPAPVAQSAELAVHNSTGAGSSPAGRTKVQPARKSAAELSRSFHSGAYLRGDHQLDDGSGGGSVICISYAKHVAQFG
jgi:hypothetical protein